MWRTQWLSLNLAVPFRQNNPVENCFSFRNPGDHRVRVCRKSNPASGTDEERRGKEVLGMTEGTKPETQLFDVIYNWPSRGIRRTIRVEAFNEDDAMSVANGVFFKNAENDTVEATKPDARRRKVHRHLPEILEATRQRIAEGRR